MGIALFLALILSLCFATVLIQDLDPLLGGAFLVGVICCLVVVFTMLSIAKDTANLVLVAPSTNANKFRRGNERVNQITET